MTMSGEKWVYISSAVAPSSASLTSRAPNECSSVRRMRRMCGLSSQIRNRSLLKSMRYMVRPRGHTGPNGIPGVNHIAAPVNEWLPGQHDPEKWTPVFRKDHAQSNRARESEPDLISELLAQDALFQAVTGVEQHPHRDRLVREHLDPADVASL